MYTPLRYLQNGDDMLAYDILPSTTGNCLEYMPAVLYLPAFDTTKDDVKGRVIMDCAASLDNTYLQMDWYGVGRSTGDFTHKGTISRWTDDALKVGSCIRHLLYVSLCFLTFSFCLLHDNLAVLAAHKGSDSHQEGHHCGRWGGSMGWP